MRFRGSALRPKPDARAHSKRSSERRSTRTPSLIFGLIVVVAVGLLAAAVFGYLSENDWAAVATVDSQVINRAQVRDREAVLSFLLEEQAEAVDSLRQQQRLPAAEAAQMTDALTTSLADVRSIAIESLVDDKFSHDYAVAQGIAVPNPSLEFELGRFRSALTERRINYITIAWQPAVAKGVAPESAVPDATQLAAIGSSVRVAIDGGTDRIAIANQYRSEGWFVTAGTRWMPAEGPVAGIAAEIVDAVRKAVVGPVPTVVGVGWVAVVDVVDELTNQSVFGQQILTDARDADVPQNALNSWAFSAAQERAVHDALLAKWATTPSVNVRAAEAVLGPADPQGPDGPWVELAHLVVCRRPRRPHPDRRWDAGRALS
jgi:hypothetical protein